MELITAAAYKKELSVEISRAKNRIVIMAMAIMLDTGTKQLLELLLAAQQRGVQVRLMYDRYTWLPLAFDHIFPSTVMRHAVQTLQAYTQELVNAGGEVLLVGKGWSHNPFAHRMHAKISIIDDTVYSFGGVNFTGNSFTYVDSMWKCQNALLADQLDTLAHTAMTTPQLKDVSLTIDDANTLLFDGGQPKHSIIYERACALAEKAEHIYYVSQMCPSGRLARAMEGKSSCYFNTPQQTGGLSKVGVAIDQWRYNITNLYKDDAYIHAKFMLFELPDGSKALISGSNNFSWRGVAFGTKEIALESHDPRMWTQLFALMQKSVST